MVTDINEELMDLDMEPKPGSLRCTRTYKDEEQRENWETPFVEVFDLLGSRFRWIGKGLQETEKHSGEVWDAGGEMGTFTTQGVCVSEGQV